MARALAAQAQASAQQGTLLPRERHKAAYQAALVQRFRHLPEVKRIERHRHLPAALYKVRAGGSGRCSIGRVRAWCMIGTEGNRLVCRCARSGADATYRPCSALRKSRASCRVRRKS
jgi:hypothetical protein